MYKEFFGFSKEPFNLDPDPRFFFLAAHHREVLNSLVDEITGERELILLVGETGTGKTILIHELLRTLPSTVKGIFIHHPPKNPG